MPTPHHAGHPALIPHHLQPPHMHVSTAVLSHRPQDTPRLLPVPRRHAQLQQPVPSVQWHLPQLRSRRHSPRRRPRHLPRRRQRRWESLRPRARIPLHSRCGGRPRTVRWSSCGPRACCRNGGRLQAQRGRGIPGLRRPGPRRQRGSTAVGPPPLRRSVTARRGKRMVGVHVRPLPERIQWDRREVLLPEAARAPSHRWYTPLVHDVAPAGSGSSTVPRAQSCASECEPGSTSQQIILSGRHETRVRSSGHGHPGRRLCCRTLAHDGV